MSNAEKQPADGKSGAGTERPRGRRLWLFTLILAIAFVGSGLVGHAPWKVLEVQNLATVQTMVDQGDLMVPMQAGKPALETPPLYFLTATGIVKGLSDYVPQGDAARVATGLYLALTLLFAGLLGRLTWQPAESKGVGAAGSMTVLILLGTLGVVWFGHDVVAASAMVAGVAMGLYGLLLLPRTVFWGGLWFGTGVGIAFMAKGLLGPAILLVTAVLMPFLATWGGLGRQVRGLLVGLVFAAPWLLVWPWLLHERDPQLFAQWLWGHNVEVYLNQIALGTQEENLQWLWTFLLMAFPAWLLAPLALILRPGAFFSLPGVRLALLVSVIGWAAMLSIDAVRPVDGVMLLVPMAVLGAGAVTRMPGEFVSGIKWVAVLLFGTIALVLWGLWAYLRFQGLLPEVEQVATLVPDGYSFVFQPHLYLVAAALTVFWLWTIMRFRAPEPAGLLAWPAGVVMVWALLIHHQPLVDQVVAQRGLIQDPARGVVVTLQAPAQSGAAVVSEEVTTEPEPTPAPVALPAPEMPSQPAGQP
mgnify:FL=1